MLIKVQNAKIQPKPKPIFSVNTGTTNAIVKLNIHALEPQIEIAVTLIFSGYISLIITDEIGPQLKLKIDINEHDIIINKIDILKSILQNKPTIEKIVIKIVNIIDPNNNNVVLLNIEIVIIDIHENIKLTSPKITGIKYGVFNSIFSNIVIP